MSIIALLTDFNDQDEYVGVMKGVILTIAPDTQLIDLCHKIPPQSIQQASLLLSRSFRFFPEGTIFCCVVDPGVGTDRKPIVARAGKWYFIGPDNGLFSKTFHEINKNKEPINIYLLDRSEFWLNQVGNTFHGRDIFAPAAAHLANGLPLTDLGSKRDGYIELEIPEPLKIPLGWAGAIIHIDSFGNCGSNLPSDIIKKMSNPVIHFKSKTITKIVKTFGDAKSGELIAVLDSANLLSICVVNGDARHEMNAQIGDKVEVIESSDNL